MVDPDLRHLHALQRELANIRARLIDAPELSEAWRRKARLALGLLELARQEAERPQRNEAQG